MTEIIDGSTDGFVIAIDGPAGAGKSTVARLVAKALDYTLIDTGAIYRCLALLAQQRGILDNEAEALGQLASEMRVQFQNQAGHPQILLNGKDVSSEIRTPEVSRAASKVSAHPQVRLALLNLQRALGKNGRVVMEGRDIGTVVFPEAHYKIFLEAPSEVRARRRHLELSKNGKIAGFKKTLEEIEERDQRDRSREAAPLCVAPGAVVIDTHGLDAKQVAKKIVDLVYG